MGDQPTVLRTARMGGFVKEDVLAYLDELQSKIYALEEERDDLTKKAESGGGLTAAQQKEFEDELSRLRGELGTTKNQLRAAQEELKNRPVIDANGDGAVSAAELEKAQAQVDEMNAKLIDATADLESVKAELSLSQEEVASLTAQLDALKNDNDSLRNDLNEASALAIDGGNSAELQAKIDEYELEIVSLKAELDAKNLMIDEQSGSSSEADLQRIAEFEAVVAEQNAALAEKTREIEDLNQQIAELKENGDDGGMDMGALFMEAQMTAKKVAVEARQKADKRISEANEQAETIIAEATAKAEQTVTAAEEQAKQTIDSANAQADETIKNANAEAERKLNDADAKAIKTVADAEESVRASLADAERRTKTTTDTARTVRALLRSEIDGVAKKFNEISLVLENLTEQAGVRLGEAKNVIGDARATVGEEDDVPSFESFDEVASKSFSKVSSGDSGAKTASFEFNFDELAKSADSNDGWSL